MKTYLGACTFSKGISSRKDVLKIVPACFNKNVSSKSNFHEK